MPTTRTSIRQAAVAFLKAYAPTVALVGTRVLDSPQTPYPGDSPHPALAVFTPGADSDPLSADQEHWQTRERLLVQCLSRRTGTQSDADLSAGADELELAVRAAVIKADALWRTLGVDRCASVKVDREPPDPSDAHRIVTFLTFELEHNEQFTATEADAENLETIRINLHLIDPATGLPYAAPDVTADVDLT